MISKLYLSQFDPNAFKTIIPDIIGFYMGSVKDLSPKSNDLVVTSGNPLADIGPDNRQTAIMFEYDDRCNMNNVSIGAANYTVSAFIRPGGGFWSKLQNQFLIDPQTLIPIFKSGDGFGAFTLSSDDMPVALAYGPAGRGGAWINYGELEYTEIPPDGSWLHLAFRCDDNKALTLFVNGLPMCAITSKVDPASLGNIASVGNCYGPNFCWAISQLCVATRAFTVDEIACLYNGGIGLNPFA